MNITASRPRLGITFPHFEPTSGSQTLSLASKTRGKWPRLGMLVALTGALALLGSAVHAGTDYTQSQIDGDPVMLCTAATGKSHGVYVDRVSVIADILAVPPGHTCNGIFEAWGELPDGSMWRKRGHAKCGLARVWVDLKAKRKFKDGVKLCGAIVLPTGKVRPEHACIDIHK